MYSSKICNPYTDPYQLPSSLKAGIAGACLKAKNQGYCAHRACWCDVNFINCLRYAKCPDLNKNHRNHHHLFEHSNKKKNIFYKG